MFPVVLCSNTFPVEVKISYHMRLLKLITKVTKLL